MIGSYVPPRATMDEYCNVLTFEIMIGHEQMMLAICSSDETFAYCHPTNQVEYYL